MRPHLLISCLLLLIGAHCFADSALDDDKRPFASFQGRALYLRPSLGGQGLGYSSFSNVGNRVIVRPQSGSNPGSNQIYTLAPIRGWGYQIQGSYFFKSGHHLDVNWYHYSRNTYGTLPSNSIFEGSQASLFPGKLEVNPRWDLLTVESGALLELNEKASIYLHAGIAYTRLSAQFISRPTLLFNGIETIFVIRDISNYYGIGPHFGVDFNHHLPFGLEAYASAGGSMLTGNAGQIVQGYNEYLERLSTKIPYGSGNFAQHNSAVVVPEFDATLGLKYQYQFAEGILEWDIDYFWVSYLNAIVNQLGLGISGASISTSRATDFGVNGLGFGLKWTGYV